MPHAALPTLSREIVLVSGAGPAGCAAALELRRRGREVLVFDRARFPRDKVCGDVLLPEALETLAELGAGPSLPIGAWCMGLRVEGPGGRAFGGPFADRAGTPRPWGTIRRMEFDAWLLDRARQAGATIVEGVEVVGPVRDGRGFVAGLRVRDESGAVREVAGSAVIGADGASGPLARALSAGSVARRPGRRRARREPRERCLAVAMRGYAEGPALPADTAEVFATESTLPGCAWLVPVGRGVCNVGAGIVLADARRRGVRVSHLLQAAGAESPHFAARLEAATLSPLRGWSLPLADPGRRLAGAGWLLAGDAANLVDPLTGHGIHAALGSGRLAGVVLDAALERGDLFDPALADRAFAAYERAIRRRYLHVRGRMILQRLQACRAVADWIASAAARSSVLASALTRLAGHVPPPGAESRLHEPWSGSPAGGSLAS